MTKYDFSLTNDMSLKIITAEGKTEWLSTTNHTPLQTPCLNEEALKNQKLHDNTRSPYAVSRGEITRWGIAGNLTLTFSWAMLKLAWGTGNPTLTDITSTPAYWPRI
jgi:hypothetical protein